MNRVCPLGVVPVELVPAGVVATCTNLGPAPAVIGTAGDVAQTNGLVFLPGTTRELTGPLYGLALWLDAVQVAQAQTIFPAGAATPRVIAEVSMVGR